MIGFLQGKILEVFEDVVIVDVNGVGYLVFVTSGKLEKNAEVKFYIHTYVKEDQLKLYGFLSRESLDLFEKLIGISGIGPKVAQRILISLGLENFCQAVIDGDLERIKSVPGIGKRTAERIVLEMRSKVSGFESEDGSTFSEGASEAMEALCRLGFGESEARKMINDLKDISDLNSAEIVKEALASRK